MNAAPETKAASTPARMPANKTRNDGRSHSISRAQGKHEPLPDFDDSTLAEIRAKLPEYLKALGTELIKRGTRKIGKCPNPSHEDNNPSFAVLPNGQTGACYPCDFKGDVFAISEWLGRSKGFPQAVREAASVVGVYVPPLNTKTATKPATAPPRPAKQPEPPFVLSAGDRAKLHAARLAFSDAFHAGDEIIDRIAASLGLDRETLRLASWGSSGLGLAPGLYGKPVWLCYAYPQGLKWRNPDPDAKAKGKPRFEWPIGKALAPWRMEWVTPSTRTVYLTEGESDCMALIAAGLEADGTAACVASPGTSFSREWVKLFTGKRVVLCFDHDDPGRKATATVAGILKGHAAEILSWKGTASHV